MVTTKLLVVFCVRLAWALDVLELSCNFSKYLLNYFEHNERYLLELVNNRNCLKNSDLKMYGAAVKSHDEIVLAMIESLRRMDRNVRLKDLNAINLYLNNVSGSVEFVIRDQNGQFGSKNYLSRKLDGFVMMHNTMKQYLKRSLMACSNVANDTAFIACPDFGGGSAGTLSPKAMFRATALLKHRILTRQQVKAGTTLAAERKKLETSEVAAVLRSATVDQSHFLYHPRYLLFYDLFSHQDEADEPYVAQAESQSRQMPQTAARAPAGDGDDDVDDEDEDDCTPANYLDFIRYADLQFSCTDNTTLVTIGDVFRYMKYNFEPSDLEAYQELVIASTLRPLSVLTFYYTNLLRKMTFSYEKKVKNLSEAPFYEKMVGMGGEILNFYEFFTKLDMFPQVTMKTLKEKIHEVYVFVAIFKNCVIDSNFYNSANRITAYVKGFMDANRFNYNLGMAVPAKRPPDTLLIEEESYTDHMRQLDSIFLHVARFMEGLPIYRHLFRNTLNSRNIVNLSFVKYSKVIFEGKGLVDRICRHNIYSDIVDVDNDQDDNGSDGYEEDKEEERTDDSDAVVRELPDIPSMPFNPKYMIDYVLPYNEP